MVGGMADLNASPLMVRPAAAITLPIWREKIAANITAAEARRDASAARVTAEQLNLAAELAQMLYMVREADRMIAYIEETALPNFDRTIATIEAGYQSGMTGPGMIPETQLMALTMRLERVDALREREIAVTELMLLTADIAPAGTPLLAANISQP
jgi:outer membrane protein TolC